MLLNHLVISLLVFVSPLFPPAIIPFAYTLIGVRLLQGAGPIGLSFSAVVPAAVSSILIRLMYGYIQNRISIFKMKRDNQDRLSIFEKKIAAYIGSRKRLNKINNKIKIYLETKNSKLALFLITILAIDSAIPDIVVIGIVRKKLPFHLFILAAVIGKATVYLPVIWAGKGILSLFGY